MNYVGNGIAFGTVQYEERMASVRGRLKNVGQVVKLDLKNQKATLMNVPLSLDGGGYVQVQLIAPHPKE